MAVKFINYAQDPCLSDILHHVFRLEEWECAPVIPAPLEVEAWDQETIS